MKGNTSAIDLTLYSTQLDKKTEEEVIEFWLVHRVLNKKEAAGRVNQVLIIARDNENHIIGVFTYALKHIPLLRNYMYLIRLFIAPSNESAFLILKMGRLALRYLKEKAQKEKVKPLGLFALVQNRKMQQKWNWAEWPKLPFTYIGNTINGQQRRVLYFNQK